MIDGLVNFNLDEVSPTIIKVIGVGGGGGNAVEYMYSKGICDVDFVLCNTDAQILENSPVPVKIQLGRELTDGHGAGNNPAIGAKSAEESLEEIKEMLRKNTKMAFITAAMGGGTGTGAAPVIAKLAKDMGILTVGIVSIPARFEGPKRLNQAREGLRSLKDNVDCLIVIDNEKIKRIYGSQTISAAFAKANDVLNIAAKGIAEVITLPGYINVDFADVKTVMTNSGVAIMGAAQASGEDRARRAITEALDSPLLNNNDIRGAKDILLNITSGTDEVTMNEMTEITSIIIHRVGDSAAVIWGVGTDESLGSAVSVTIIATGFPKDDIEILDQQPGDRKAENDLILRDDEVVLKPNLTPEEIKELIEEPAFKRRRNVRII
ncbi:MULTISPECIES: cell division protein FtsZ [Culturomica]|jgi:cell division protein FtsZ|uniref:cell division protein FtsZ n=1 Tax=Culturomica TaxID=1926651 RepID=UPI000340E0AC|nr:MULTISPECIES: cell division protein FtsZ [Odoribacteraceae]RHV94202.1 cell division protein FtsZ [Odoribacter sp. OF09-27XD]CCZ09983.1 cell division protein FtsZ 1 [Odoribacter sp. CAG:788]HBO27667.1 cell division protein FtsZ [Culturomica sp.]